MVSHSTLHNSITEQNDSPGLKSRKRNSCSGTVRVVALLLRCTTRLELRKSKKSPRKILRLRIDRDTFKIRAKIRLIDFNPESPEYFFILSCGVKRCVFRFHALRQSRMCRGFVNFELVDSRLNAAITNEQKIFTLNIFAWTINTLRSEGER